MQWQLIPNKFEEGSGEGLSEELFQENISIMVESCAYAT